MTTPFIKWAGGKRAISPTILKNCPPQINNYHEPFLGGGSIFLTLLEANKIKPQKSFLSDLNLELMTTYRVISEKLPDLIFLLKKHSKFHKLDDDYFYKIRSSNPSRPVDQAARFIYLNKTCFNGLYRVNGKGLFNVPKGNYQDPQIYRTENLQEWSHILKKTTLLDQPFCDLINANYEDFIYCDPPYDKAYNQYQSAGFPRKSQIQLKKKIDEWASSGANIMLSNSDTEFIRNLFKDYNIQVVTNHRSISCTDTKRGKTSELLITNY